jgi:mRNA interferase MazF
MTDDGLIPSTLLPAVEFMAAANTRRACYTSDRHTTGAGMAIRQGDIFWVQLNDTDIPHPHVVIQADDSAVTICALTSNIKRINWPGTVLLDAGEAGLQKTSVAEVYKVSTVDPSQLGAYIGSLSQARLNQIRAGMRFVQTTFSGHHEDRL